MTCCRWWSSWPECLWEMLLDIIVVPNVIFIPEFLMARVNGSVISVGRVWLAKFLLKFFWNRKVEFKSWWIMSVIPSKIWRWTKFKIGAPACILILWIVADPLSAYIEANRRNEFKMATLVWSILRKLVTAVGIGVILFPIVTISLEIGSVAIPLTLSLLNSLWEFASCATRCSCSKQLRHDWIDVRNRSRISLVAFLSSARIKLFYSKFDLKLVQ